MRGGGGNRAGVVGNRHNAAVVDYLQLLLQHMCMLCKIACA